MRACYHFVDIRSSMEKEIQFSIRRCRPGDEETLALVGSASFLETFTGILRGTDIVGHCRREHASSRYAEWLAQPSSRIYIAETPIGNGPMGYIVLDDPKLPLDEISSADQELKRIYLLHRFQGTGVGQALMEKAIAAAKEAGKRRLLLGVYSKNHRAIAFYKRNGFVEVGERYFQVGENTYHDAVLARTL